MSQLTSQEPSPLSLSNKDRELVTFMFPQHPLIINNLIIEKKLPPSYIYTPIYLDQTFYHFHTVYQVLGIQTAIGH
jgi:hypothetical protein